MLSRFDERDLAEITAPEFPAERLVVCKNPLLAKERATEGRQTTKVAIAVASLNRMLELGRPEYVRLT